MNTDLKYASLFTIITLILSYIFTYINYFFDDNLTFLPYVMFIPSIVGFVLYGIRYKSLCQLFSPIFQKLNIKVLGFSIFYPLLFIALISLMTYLLGVTTYNPSKVYKLFQFPSASALIFGLLLVMGEEYGWRGFLLQTLSNTKGKNFATVATGIIWGLWHAPIILILGCIHQIEYPFILMLLQLAAVFVFSFPFAYTYFKSNSIIPPMLFHYVWNRYNPILLGSVYYNQQGIFEGSIPFINGEGLAGVLLGIPFVLWYLKRNKDQYNNYL